MRTGIAFSRLNKKSSLNSATAEHGERSLIRDKKPIMWGCSDQPRRETGAGDESPHPCGGLFAYPHYKKTDQSYGKQTRVVFCRNADLFWSDFWIHYSLRGYRLSRKNKRSEYVGGISCRA